MSGVPEGLRTISIDCSLCWGSTHTTWTVGTDCGCVKCLKEMGRGVEMLEMVIATLVVVTVLGLPVVLSYRFQRKHDEWVRRHNSSG